MSWKSTLRNIVSYPANKDAYKQRRTNGEVTVKQSLNYRIYSTVYTSVIVGAMGVSTN